MIQPPLVDLVGDAEFVIPQQLRIFRVLKKVIPSMCGKLDTSKLLMLVHLGQFLIIYDREAHSLLNLIYDYCR